jgi:hypothetical protein
MNLTVNHNSFTEALLFIDDPISANTHLKTESNFYGGQVGAGVIYTLPSPDNQLRIGISGNAAFGENTTDGTALGLYRCVPCGAGSPEFDFSLKRNFDESNFSAIYGGEAFASWTGGNIEIRLLATVEHMTNVPAFDVPFTPVQQPIRLIEDDLTNATVGVRVSYDLGSFDIR